MIPKVMQVRDFFHTQPTELSAAHSASHVITRAVVHLDDECTAARTRLYLICTRSAVLRKLHLHLYHVLWLMQTQYSLKEVQSKIKNSYNTYMLTCLIGFCTVPFNTTSI